jgi:hypothetical protein
MATIERVQHQGDPPLRAWTKSRHGTIEREIAKARQGIVAGVSKKREQ